MAIIYEQSLFSWKDVESLGDLERLKLVLENLPDENLMFILERKRKNGRNDYPIRPTWNAMIAAIVFQHKSIESLRRELLRNAQLRELCGFDVIPGLAIVPTSSAFSRFLRSLLEHRAEIEAIFKELVQRLGEVLPDFGKQMAMDSKAIDSLASARNRPIPEEKEDGRREVDADLGVKKYSGVSDNGIAWEKVKSWVGFKVHMLVDANYELPISYTITKASVSDAPEAHRLIEKACKDQPEIFGRCEFIMADRGYDDTRLIMKLWDQYRIKPVIDIRNMWRDGETGRLLSEETNVTYDYRGTVMCHCPVTGEERKMAFGGFENDRSTLKYLCPVKAYGVHCAGCAECPIKHAIRINMEENRRVFTPVARSAYKWEDLYKKRTAVERVNSRLDVSFGFEEHFIRGVKKMEFRCGLALCVMLGMALGRIRQGQPELMRSLVKMRAA